MERGKAHQGNSALTEWNPNPAALRGSVARGEPETWPGLGMGWTMRNSMKRNSLLGLFVVFGASVALAQSTNHIAIEELRQLRLPDVVLESVAAQNSDKAPNAKGHVEVKGLIGGNIRFE